MGAVAGKKNKLKGLRGEYGYSQEYMAEYLGIGLSTFNRKENGTDGLEFTLTEAKKIADIFGVKVDDIFFADNVSKRNVMHTQCRRIN